MINFFLFVLSTVGMTFVIVDGSILESFRTLVKTTADKWGVSTLGSVVDCYLCCGTWCGFLMGWIWLTHHPAQVFACGCAGAVISNFGAALFNWVEAATIRNLPEK